MGELINIALIVSYFHSYMYMYVTETQLTIIFFQGMCLLNMLKVNLANTSTVLNSGF